MTKHPNPIFLNGSLGTTWSEDPSAPCTGIIVPGAPVILGGNSGEVGTVVKVFRHYLDTGGTGDEDAYIAFEGYPDKARHILPLTYETYDIVCEACKGFLCCEEVCPDCGWKPPEDARSERVTRDLRDLEGNHELGAPLMSETTQPYVLRYFTGSLLLRLDIERGRRVAVEWLCRALGFETPGLGDRAFWSHDGRWWVGGKDEMSVCIHPPKRPPPQGYRAIEVEMLAGYDPWDDSRFEDGYRWVDALALKYACEAVAEVSA